jgi:hypothetical protein
MTAGDPSEEPIAGKPHDGICGGESQQWLSYPTKNSLADSIFAGDLQLRY